MAPSDRRGGSSKPAAIAHQATSPRPATPTELRQVQPTSLTALQDGLRALNGAYGRAPATSLLPAASQHLAQISAIRESRLTSSVRRELDARDADTAMLVGQLVWDASQRRDHATPRMYFVQAIAAAGRAGDPVLTAHGSCATATSRSRRGRPTRRPPVRPAVSRCGQRLQATPEHPKLRPCALPPPLRPGRQSRSCSRSTSSSAAVWQ